jgi:muramoyltetrapeptide carboxypeptidase
MASALTKIVIPPPLQPGDRVAVTATSGPVDPAVLENGIGVLTSLGLSVATGSYLAERDGYLAGSDEQRAEDVNRFLADPDVRAVMFARGGYGVTRILDRIELDRLRDDPKLLVGMSDLTAFQLAVSSSVGLVTFSGPMVAGQVGSGLDAGSRESLQAALFEPIDERNLTESIRTGLRVVRAGTARGTLLGGCLSMVVALLGTRYCPDFEGAVLFLEDINEPLYRIDRMLTHLKLAGVLDRISAVLACRFLGPKKSDLSLETDRLLLEATAHRPVPILAGYPHGHALPNLTLPHGARILVRTDSLMLQVIA